MAVQVFLGQPAAHIKQWMIDHPPTPPEDPDPDLVDESSQGKLVAALENCTPDQFNGLNYTGTDEHVQEK